MEYNVHTLPNGIRLLHVPAASAISHACIIVNTGSRDEPEGKAGLAHFIEHLIFKRTEKRNTNQILNHLESVGADLNAYTTKEYTCVHASFLNPYLARTLDLFNDILFHSTFPEEEMDKEKSVILDEISSYLDQPEEAINDDFEDMLFAGHALGNNILGTTESVQHFTREDVMNFRKANYRTSEIVVAVLGNYTLNHVVKKGSKYFADVEENNPKKVRVKPTILPPSNNTIYKPIMQSHCILGTQAYSTHQSQKVPLMLLNNYFGGNGMSSVLNLQIRERYGIAYTIESNFSPLSDTGIFSVYFGTDKEKQAKALSLIFKEIKKLRDRPLNDLQLQKAKNKFIGQIALGEENRIGLIISMAKSLIDHNQIDSLETVFEKINAVTTRQMIEVTNEILNIEQLSVFTFCPIAE
ncbi:Predicted Zn-dependent peptidase [Pedobacter suwonensis]|uniref:Predicted Zn-dependent peptidase n=1 Tax=Pedobacter suwonensis TaxID=332999 RepID=A0A1I0SVI1_9SPHI|nr:pitrilysin family protein [Pedobacter suwonensis]SFA43417.1 Predicted Zn-dependent peptidase [Pedobacter suwonensis]